MRGVYHRRAIGVLIMKLYLVLVYDADEGRYIVYADYDNEMDAVDTLAECGGVLRVVEV